MTVLTKSCFSCSAALQVLDPHVFAIRELRCRPALNHSLCLRVSVKICIRAMEGIYFSSVK